jgi:hypothetical protein
LRVEEGRRGMGVRGGRLRRSNGCSVFATANLGVQVSIRMCKSHSLQIPINLHQYGPVDAEPAKNRRSKRREWKNVGRNATSKKERRGWVGFVGSVGRMGEARDGGSDPKVNGANDNGSARRQRDRL